METIVIRRLDPASGELADAASFRALVAPVSVEDTPTGRAMPVTVGYTLYIRGMPTGVLDTDLVLVRGELLAVTGKPAQWRNPDGSHAGDVVNVKFRKGGQ